MAFFEQRLDPQVTFGALGGPKFKTTILELGSGFEKRNIEWSKVRGEWDISYKIKTQAELDAIRAMFFIAQGRAHGFRFKDWTDYRVPRQVIGATDGTRTDFQMFKTYDATITSYNRDIKKPVLGTVTVWVGGSLAGTLDYAVDYTTGIITLGAPDAALVGANVEYQAEFDVPVRFDIDHLPVSIDHYNVLSAASIPLVELRPTQ